MKNLSKNRKKILHNLDLTKIYNANEAIEILKNNSFTKFDETLDVAIKLNIDPKKTDQNVRGSINLPKGTGKKIRIAVIAEGSKAKEAKENGAEIVGDKDLIQKISKGEINFDLLITTPDMMPNVSKIGKILGPKGLMPNPKLGTVTQDLSSAVKKAKAGQVQYKNDKAGIVHAGIGKLKFTQEDLLDNLKTFFNEINKNKPDNVKGTFVKKVSIASTMGFGLKVNLGDLR